MSTVILAPAHDRPTNRQLSIEGVSRLAGTVLLLVLAAWTVRGEARWAIVACVLAAGSVTVVIDITMPRSRPVRRAAAFAAVDTVTIGLAGLAYPRFWNAIIVVAGVAATTYAIRLNRSAFAFCFVALVAELVLTGALGDAHWGVPIAAMAISLPPIAVAAAIVRTDAALRLARMETIASSVEAIFWAAHDGRRIVDLLGPVERLTGMTPAEFIGWRAERFEADGLPDADTSKGRTFQLTHRTTGESVWLSETITSPVDDSGVPQFRGVITDVTQLVLAEQAADRLANHDPVTGAANAAGFRRALAALSPAHLADMALVVVRVRHLGHISDLWGRSEAQACVAEIHRRLVASLPDAVVVARLAEDEFGAVTPADLGRLADLEAGIGRALSARVITLDGTIVDPNVAIHATPMSAASSVGEILEASEFYLRLLPVDLRRTRNDMRIDTRAVTANLEGVIDVWYQPIVEGYSGELVAFEALARHLVDGTPTDTECVIDVLDSFGLSQRLDRHIIARVLQDVAASRGRIPETVRFSINVSQKSLSEASFAHTFLATCEAARVEPSRITVEVSERHIAPDEAEVHRTLTLLREFGVGVALDDYGTGHSTLTRIKNLPINEVKIDRSFVQGMITRETDEIIVRSTIQMTKALGLRVVAEGVEDAHLLAYLRHLGCDLVQGYYFAPARPLREAILASESGALSR